ncbi:translation initiation factor 2 [Phytomonospora sp. NPDC050363]|uniref:translation initiation factor 2 n=1 Tax=Phytomonospora sp. NPDC050363 TaxID=3155642 RepID=UPI0033F20688
MTDSDAVWRRPAEGGDAGNMEVVVPPAAPSPRYDGPPRATPPPRGWRVPVVVNAAPPRTMPAQDHAAADAAERSARTFSVGLGILFGAVMLILLLVVIVRAIS